MAPSRNVTYYHSSHLSRSIGPPLPPHKGEARSVIAEAGVDAVRTDGPKWGGFVESQEWS